MINKDAFSSGQIGSKIWLCEELERIGWESKDTWIYGGWYALTAFLLLSRGKFKVKRISSFDIDPACEPIADMINENWLWQNWTFKAFTKDCNKIDHVAADLVINTSSEHFDTMEWFDNIPEGTRLIIQGNNMNHDDHVIHSNNLEEFKSHYPLSHINFEGQKSFVYPDWSFTRFMLIGIK